MTNKGIFRSPLFYVGDKYKLMREIKTHLPKRIRTFVEPFVEGGSVFMNVEAENYLLNDIDSWVVGIHQYLCGHNKNKDQFFDELFALVDHYGLSCSYRNDVIPDKLKKEFPKTYFAKYNKEAFIRMRSDFNKGEKDDMLHLYVLLIYGFNRMLRFNREGNYNLPVGNVDFNKNVYNALSDYFSITNSKHIIWSNLDFRQFLLSCHLSKDDFVYLDPPYLITFSEYNKLWDEETEKDLLALLDFLDGEKIKFAISNVTHYKGKVNSIFLEWSAKYNVYTIKSNYISYHDNTSKTFNEVLVTNY